MKIVILDGYPLNPGDLTWEQIEQMGDVSIYDRTPPDEVVNRCADAEIVLTNKITIPADVIDQLPRLRYIGVLATGYNIIDIDAAKRRRVVVTNVPGYSTASVAQLTFALLLELCHRVQRHSDAVTGGQWSRNPDFSFWNHPLMELNEKTIGIIGMGDIGKQVATIAEAFGMRVIAASRTHSDQSHRRHFRWATNEELFAEADVVTLHCPLVPETKGLVNSDRLSTMKRTAYLINTSRGPLVQEHELAQALHNRMIAGAAVDVVAEEPPVNGSPLFSAPNCIVTPHIAWATIEARKRLMERVIDNLRGYLAGQPVNVVN